jgi:hypothetical protein
MTRAPVVAPGLALAVAAALGSAALGLGAPGCRRAPARCPAGTRSTVEIRDGNGALEIALKGSQICDGQLRAIGDVTRAPDGALLVRDPGADPTAPARLTLRRDSDTVAQVSSAAGPRWRLYRDAKELRVLQPDGVPLGSIVPDPGAAVLYNPQQSPLGRVQRRDHDAVVTNLSGATLTYVVPAADPVAAGVFGLPKLDRLDQLAIYLYWSR